MARKHKCKSKHFREKFSQGKTKFETEGNYNTTLKSEINKHSNTQTSTRDIKSPAIIRYYEKKCSKRSSRGRGEGKEGRRGGEE